MNNRVERLRYYDGEYLRSYDFQAEQAYHVEMRRRLNLLLHLYGVAYGLQLDQDEDSKPPEAPLFVIKPGLAIDQIGREIVIENPYVLRSEEVLNRAGIKTGQNEIWICYREDPGGLPAAGYGLCNDPNQNTRVRESFDVLLVPIPKPAPEKGVELADPDTQRKGVRLGTVEVENAPGGGLRIGKVTNEKRTYAGIRAQRVVSPDTSPDTFDVLKKNETAAGGPLAGYLDIDPPVFVRGNFMAHKNAVVGPDFEVKAADAFTSLPPDLADPGDLKIANYLILQKGLIASIKGKWYLLDEYIQSKMPEFVVDSTTIPVDVANTPPAAIAKTSKLPFVSNASIVVCLNGIVWQNKANLNTWWGTLGSDPIQIKVSAVPSRQGSSPNTWEFAFSYTVAPANVIVNVQQLIVNYLIVFYP